MRQAGRYLPEYRAVRAQGRQLPRALLHARARRRGDAAADPPLRLRRGDPLRRHPAGAAGARRRPRLRRGRGSAALDGDDRRRPRPPAARPRRCTRPSPRSTRPCAGCAPSCRADGAADRLRRGALDRRHLHDRRPRHPGPGAGAASSLYRDPATFDALIERITEATIAYLLAQIEAGAEVVKLFDSWAGALPGPLFARYAIAPGPAHRRGAAGGASRRCRSSASRAAPAPATPASPRRPACRRVALDTVGRPGLGGARAAAAPLRPGQPRPAAAGGRRRGARATATRAHRRGLRRRPARLQPRPRHHPGGRSGATSRRCCGRSAAEPAQSPGVSAPERFSTSTPARIRPTPSTPGWSSRWPKPIQPTATISTIPSPDQIA